MGKEIEKVNPGRKRVRHTKAFKLEGDVLLRAVVGPDGRVRDVTVLRPVHPLLDEAAGLIEASVLKSTLKENLGPINAANLRRAHKLLEEGHVVGKLVLEGWGA